MFLQRRFEWRFSVLFWWIVIANLRNGFCYLLHAVSTKFARLNLPPPPLCLFVSNCRKTWISLIWILAFIMDFFFHQGLLACEKHYREALRLRPHYVAAWENLGLVLLNTGKVVKPKPMLSQWPIRNKWISLRARRAGKRARPSRYWYEFVIDWLRWWYKFSGPITERKKGKSGRW